MKRDATVPLIAALLSIACLFVGALACGSAPSARTASTRATEAKAWPTAPEIPVEAEDARWGAAEAPVTLVAFLDFECPFCSKVHQTLKNLSDHYGAEQLRVIVKHSPLAFHQRGIPSARAAQAVWRSAGEEAFFEYIQLLFENTDGLSDSNLAQWATEVGVEPSRFRGQLDSDEVGAKLARDAVLAERLGVNGVPAFFINGASLVGAESEERFRGIIDHELRAAELLIRKGVPKAELYAARVKVNYHPSETAQAAMLAFRVPIDDSPILGNPNAPVTIVEFADFECPFCARAHGTLQKLLDQYPGRVRWVMKHTPLAFHRLAVPAAIVAIETRQQKGDVAYWEVIDRLMDPEPLSQRKLDSIAQEMALDRSDLSHALALGLDHPRLVSDIDLAMDLESGGTPSFFINGRRLSGARPISEFAAALESALAEASALAESGVPPEELYARLQADALPGPGLTQVDVTPPAPGQAPSLGPADAPVVVQMFTDFECPFCARVLPTLSSLRARFPEQVRIVWHHFPLEFHPHARDAALAAIEVYSQGGDAAFWRLAEELFGGSGEDSLTRPGLQRAVAALGLDGERFAVSLDDQRHLPRLNADIALAARLGIRGTPGFLINGYRLEGAQPLRRFERLVRLALQDHEQHRGALSLVHPDEPR